METFKQYTKRFVTSITVFAAIWISWSYVLATLQFLKTGITDMLESLSSNVCTVILGTSIGYMIKSFVETYSEKKNILDTKKHDDVIDLLTNVDSDISPDEIVGIYKKL